MSLSIWANCSPIQYFSKAPLSLVYSTALYNPPTQLVNTPAPRFSTSIVEGQP